MMHPINVTLTTIWAKESIGRIDRIVLKSEHCGSEVGELIRDECEEIVDRLGKIVKMMEDENEKEKRNAMACKGD